PEVRITVQCEPENDAPCLEMVAGYRQYSVNGANSLVREFLRGFNREERIVPRDGDDPAPDHRGDFPAELLRGHQHPDGDNVTNPPMIAFHDEGEFYVRRRSHNVSNGGPLRRFVLHRC